MRLFLIRQRLVATIFGAVVIAIAVGSYFRPAAQAQTNLTPGMLFGPLSVGQGQHVELCGSYLSEGVVTSLVHFRNITTGEVTTPQEITMKSGGGDCAVYSGKGRVVGLSRGEGPGADWVSPSNALIGTMSVVDDGGSVRAAVLGVAKLWQRGL